MVAKFLHADNEGSDQTARMRRLIWVFVGRTRPKVRFLTLRSKLRLVYISCRLDNYLNYELTIKHGIKFLNDPIEHAVLEIDNASTIRKEPAL